MIQQKDDIDEFFIQIQNWVIEYKTTKNLKLKDELKKLITVATMPFVKRIALGLARRSTDPADDLIQAGALGLIKAIESYEINMTKFKTYATYYITGEIKHYLRDKVTVIKPPRDIRDLSYRINSLLMNIKMDGSDVSAEKIAEVLCVPVEKVNEVIDVDRRRKVLSLDEIIVKEDNCFVPLIDKIPDKDYKDLLDMYEEKIILKDAINKLDDKLKETIIMVYYKDLSQKQVSERLNISQMQVSRRLRQAFEELHTIITEEAV